MICSRKGYKLKVVMADQATPERTQLLSMYGAEIVYSDGTQGSNGAVAKALEMAAEDPVGRQARPTSTATRLILNAHYNGTALEILEKLDQATAFVAGLGTGRGGMLMGNGRLLEGGHSATPSRSSPPSRCRASRCRACARSTTASSRRSSTSRCSIARSSSTNP